MLNLAQLLRIPRQRAGYVSLNARDKLVELGKNVELLLYEDEEHSFLKMENMIDSELRRVEFLARRLEK